MATHSRVRHRRPRANRYSLDPDSMIHLEQASPNDAEAREAYGILRDRLPTCMPDATGAWPGLWQFEPGIPARWRWPQSRPDRSRHGALLLRSADDEQAWRADRRARQTYLLEHDLLADWARAWPTTRPAWWFVPESAASA